LAFTVNGCGTSICPARGFTRLNGATNSNHDSVVCFVMLYLPLIPLQAMHTHSWNGTQCMVVPIRWSADLVLRAFARRWLFALLAAAAMLAFAGVCTLGEVDKHAPVGMLVTSAILLAVALGLLRLLGNSDRRHRAIRSLIGPHKLGTSDPATWAPEVLKHLPPSMELFGTPTDSSAVPALLEKQQYANAMYAARLTAAREDAAGGEALTEKVLADPGARALLERLPAPGFWARFN